MAKPRRPRADRGGRTISDLITFYDYWRSSAAYRLRIALNLCNLPYSAVPVDLLAGEQKGAEHLARHPQGLVPALTIDGQTFTQSLAILEYLDETRGAGFLPEAPKDRARVRAVSYAIAMEIHPVCNLSVARFAQDASHGAIAMADWMQRFIRPGLEAVERMLAAGPAGRFCHGNSVTMADICLVPQFYNARRWQVETTDLPNISRITKALEAQPAFAAAHPDEHAPPSG